MTTVLYIQSRNRAEPLPSAYTTGPFRLKTVHVSELPDVPTFLDHELTLIPMQSDEVMLGRKSAWLEGVWQQGGAILANDVIARPYLPFLSPFEPIPLASDRAFKVRPHTPHPAFDGLPFDTFALREGMAGVYGVGHNPPPPGATIVNTIGHGAYAIDWYFDGPRGALFFCHGGPDISGFHSEVDDRPNLTHRLVKWMMERPR